MVATQEEATPNILARLLRRGARGSHIECSTLNKAASALENPPPQFSMAAMEQALLTEYAIRRQGSTVILLRDKRPNGLDAGSFHPPTYTIVRLPLFCRDYLSRENLSQHWHENMPADFLAWILLSAQPFDKERDHITWNSKINQPATKEDK